jgi:hypothetical protein
MQPNPRYAEFLDQARVRELVVAQQSGAKNVDSHFLLAVLMLEVWLDSFVQRARFASLRPELEVR